MYSILPCSCCACKCRYHIFVVPCLPLTPQDAVRDGGFCFLQGYEIPRDFIVVTEPFSKANHLLTDSSKPARGNLKAK